MTAAETRYVAADVDRLRAGVAALRTALAQRGHTEIVVGLQRTESRKGGQQVWTHTADLCRALGLAALERPRAYTCRCACGAQGDPRQPIGGSVEGRPAAWASCPQHPDRAVGLPLGTRYVTLPVDLAVVLD